MTRSARGRLRQVWADLSLRDQLLLFALALVTLPGALFALLAFSGARTALEREIGIQLQQTAERGADAIAAAVDRARSDARAWAKQDIMRDLMIDDLDKRVSRFLAAARASDTAYLEVLCVDRDGRVVASGSGGWLGRDMRRSSAPPAAAGESAALVGPIASAELGRETVEVEVPINNPDSPDERIGNLILIYDWAAVLRPLQDIRRKLAGLGKGVAAIVVDRDGVPLGGISYDGRPAAKPELAAATGRGDILLGRAAVPDPGVGWSVVFVEPESEALAAVADIRRRWAVIIAAILVAGSAVAILLARQVMRPLKEVTEATSALAADPDAERALLPVRSRNEVGQLTESFNTMTVQLKRSQEEALSAAKLAFAGELAAIVAHEVRTPLSVMRSSAQMLAAPASSPARHSEELAETIVAEVDRVERVVTGLLQLARPMKQCLEPTQLRDVLSRACELTAAEAERRGVTVSRDLRELARPALCDPEQIYQVVLNLIVNALQVLPSGGTIRLRLLDSGDGGTGFEIRDDGPGLPREVESRLFQPFVSGRDGGTGLGLAFVDRVVKAHHGSVSVQSSREGTVFQVRLPVAEVPA